MTYKLREIERHRRNAELMLEIVVKLSGDARIAFQSAGKELIAVREGIRELIDEAEVVNEQIAEPETVEVAELSEPKHVGRWKLRTDGATARQNLMLRRY